VVIDESLLSTPIDALCGEQTTLNFDVWNIGDTDFADQFLVNLINTELGLNLNTTYVGDLDAGETASLSFVLDIPNDAEAKSIPYTLVMQTFYEYDADGGKYETYYDRKSENTFDALLKVGGNCIVKGEATFETDKTDIVSGGKAGEPLTVKTTIKNSGTKTADYIINTANYTAWASSANIDTKTFTLTAGESKEITITLDVKKGISGEQTFNVEVVSGNEIVMTQPVSALIEGSSGLFEGITGSSILGGGSSYLWIIGFVNVILIGSIIVVAVRLLRR
ncbi:MAG: putative S-layer protein, partial [Patescibacteria group bacterium]